MALLTNKPVSKTLRTEVKEIIHDAIVSGVLNPGDHLKETEIADQLSVSRSPVREAFRQLEQDGLLVSLPNQGTFVKNYNAKEIEEIFLLRAVLENLAFELLITGNKLKEEDWTRLDRYIEKQRAAIDSEDYPQLTKLDMDFHEFLCRKSESERLVGMWKSLRSQIQVLFYQRFEAMDRITDTVESDHMALLDGLKLGDIVALKQLNRQINARVAQECIEIAGLSIEA
ncbi:MAG: GntR family transcriptional regulator [Chloroflexi bacterium]|nr:MAG: GntR family transcriptional regulator [Chloroflexota bacterium]